MSAGTFLLILAVVIVIFIGLVVRSWSALANVPRPRRKRRRADGSSDDHDAPRH